MDEEEQRRFLYRLDYRNGVTGRLGGDLVTAEFEAEDEALLREILDNPSSHVCAKLRAACWLACLGDPGSIEILCDLHENPKTRAEEKWLINYTLPALAKSERFKLWLLSHLDPAQTGFDEFVAIAGQQGNEEILARLEEILRSDQAVPSLDKVAFWVGLRHPTPELLEVTLRYLDQERAIPVEIQPWTALVTFAQLAELRKRILQFCRDFGEPPEYYWWLNYGSLLCRFGGPDELPEIERMIDAPTRFHFNPVDALERILGQEAVPRLLLLLQHPRWGRNAGWKLGSLLKGTGHPGMIADLARQAEETQEAEQEESRLFGILQTAMEVGGPEARELVGKHIHRVPERHRTDLWWEWNGLRLEDFAECLARHGAKPRDPAECRDRYPHYRESGLMWFVMGDHFLKVDCESKDVPVPHDQLLERIARKLRGSGFKWMKSARWRQARMKREDGTWRFGLCSKECLTRFRRLLRRSISMWSPSPRNCKLALRRPGRIGGCFLSMNLDLNTIGKIRGTHSRR